jgi:hypothetical protein
MTQHKATARSVEHLKPHQWKKGQSGNPKGRPKRQTFDELVKIILNERVGGGQTRQELIARRFVDEMMAGNPAAMHEALKRLWPAETTVSVRDAEGVLNKRIPPSLQDVAAVLAEIGAIKAPIIPDPIKQAIDVTPGVKVVDTEK